jgi:UDP-glucose/iron transport system ATP-binding protein
MGDLHLSKRKTMPVSDLLAVTKLTLLRGTEILKDISFALSSGDFLLILGPSGSGKSSLLRCLNRLETISAGTVCLEGQDARSIDTVDLRRNIGMVFQTPALLPGTVRENIAIGPNMHKVSLTEAVCESLVEKVGLDRGFLDRPAEALSIGEQQRVALAQTLANRPKVLMLDEPTSALDPTAVLTIERLIQSINRDLKTAVLWVTHDVAQAVRFNARTLILMDGEILAQGNIRELMASCENETLQRFFKGTMGANPVDQRQGDADGK